jgi:PAS domain S-box-containing protein
MVHELQERAEAERKVAEALRESQEKYRSIFRNAIEGIFQSTPEGRFIDVNPAFVRIIGYQSPKEMITGISNIGEQLYVHPEQRRELMRRLEKGPVSNFDAQVYRKDGDIRWVSFNIRAIYDDKKDLHYLEGTVQDITERKMAQEALAMEKERLAVTLRSIGDGVITTDTEGRVVLMNKVAEELTAWSQEDAAGKPLTEIFHIVDERTLEPCKNPVERVIETGLIQRFTNNPMLISSDGSERIIADSGAPIFDKNSEMIGVVLVFRDVTRQRRMEEDLFKAHKLESIGVLAGGIAHDFNNILTAILGNICLAKMLSEPGTKIHEKLSETQKASVRAKDLTQQLLTFARGGVPIKRVMSISKFIRDSIDFALRGSNVKCEFSVPDDLWLVDVDEGQVNQVINNLVINADQAMPEGGVLAVSAENTVVSDSQGLALKPGSYIKVSIADNGVGIPPEILPKVFDPYFTTKEKGHGLGLAMSFAIVNQHGGLITAESKVGEGTVFSVFLPASLDELKESEDAEVTPLCGKGRILVMDDEETVRKVVMEMLSHMGYEVMLSQDGMEAIELFLNARKVGAPFDAVIMDLTIPGGVGGKEAVKRLLEIDPDVKAIVSSGYSNDPIMADYRRHGFLGVVVKPFEVEELSQMLRKVLGGTHH